MLIDRMMMIEWVMMVDAWLMMMVMRFSSFVKQPLFQKFLNLALPGFAGH